MKLKGTTKNSIYSDATSQEARDMISEHIEPLISMVSKDETRWHLTGVNMNKKLQMAVSTDGHRLFASSEVYQEAHADKTVRAQFIKDWEFIEMKDVRYPDVTQFVPNPMKWKNCIEVTIPPFFKSFKKLTKGVKNVAVELNVSGAYPFFAFTHVSHKVVEHERRICFNAHYLAELAGWSVFIRWNDDVSPMLITPEIKDAKFCKWFMVLMPMRGGEMITAKIPESFLTTVDFSPAEKNDPVDETKIQPSEVEDMRTNSRRPKAIKLNLNKGDKWKTSYQSTSSAEVTT